METPTATTSAEPEPDIEPVVAAAAAPVDEETEPETAPSGHPMADGAGRPFRRWRALAVLEGVWTGDDRFIEPEALTWRDFPLSLMAQTETAAGHDGAQLVGRIDSAERVDASGMVDSRTGQPYGDGTTAIMMSGVFDSDQLATATADRITGGFLRGVSVDMSDMEYVDELTDGDGNPVSIDDIDSGRVDPMDIRLRTRVTGGRLMGLTATPFPAFEGAFIQLLDEDGNAGPAMEPGQPSQEQQKAAVRASAAPNQRRCLPCEAAGITASAAPVEPPAGWFADPQLDGPTGLTVGDDGRVFGHLAVWDTCHTGISGRCVTPPRSVTGYAVFRTGSVRCADGTDIAVGQLTAGTSHADTRPGVGAVETLRHYDHTGTAVADVAAGEDAYGIWVAGALRPEATAEQIRVLRASPLSGDWRPWGDGLELVGALAVNVPGFPVLRQIVASGRTSALIAAGPPPADPLVEVRELLPALTAAAARELRAQQADADAATAARDARAAGLRARRLSARRDALRPRLDALTKGN